jgi:hypothetical protein
MQKKGTFLILITNQQTVNKHIFCPRRGEGKGKGEGWGRGREKEKASPMHMSQRQKNAPQAFLLSVPCPLQWLSEHFSCPAFWKMLIGLLQSKGSQAALN